MFGRAEQRAAVGGGALQVRVCIRRVGGFVPRTWVCGAFECARAEVSAPAYVCFLPSLSPPPPHTHTNTHTHTPLRAPLPCQFAPGAGGDAIYVQRLKSWYHWWRWVVLTTAPQAAAPLPLPPRPLALSTPTRASPLVRAVNDSAMLRVRGARCAGAGARV